MILSQKNHKNAFQRAQINNKPLLLDGAIGSYLQQKGFMTDDILWTTKINFSNPEVIVKIHSEYIEAGADIITTNSFRTNPSSLEASRFSDFSFYVKKAVQLAKEAIEGKEILIAGSNAPAEDCYQSLRTLSKYKLERNHMKHIDLLIDNGVSFILNETQSHFDEIKIICEHCVKNNIPNVISLYLTESLNILSGESLRTILNYLNNSQVLSIGINCVSTQVLFKIIGSTSLPDSWGFYLNCGNGNQSDKFIQCGIQPNDYLEYVKRSIPYSPSFIGSCCGSNPAHTKILREYLDGKSYN